LPRLHRRKSREFLSVSARFSGPFDDTVDVALLVRGEALENLRQRRTALAPDCMQIVAGHLTEEDVNAIAAYLSSTPAPQDPAPVKKDSYALPFACGSQPN
jgi:cytochrome c553